MLEAALELAYSALSLKRLLCTLFSARLVSTVLDSALREFDFRTQPEVMENERCAANKSESMVHWQDQQCSLRPVLRSL